MIHEAFSRAQVALRYYRKKGSELSNENARKRFFLDERDGRIDNALLKKVMREIYSEQKKLLSSLAPH